MTRKYLLHDVGSKNTTLTLTFELRLGDIPDVGNCVGKWIPLNVGKWL